MADRPEGRPGPRDQHGRHRGPAYPQEQVGAPRRVPGPCGRRAGDRADHRLRDDDGRRAGQHGRGERSDDGRPRPLPAAARGQPAAASTQGLEVYGDSAYGTGQARADYQAAGHDTVIKPGPLRPAVPGGFTLDDFTLDEEQGTVTCPAGHVRPMSQQADRHLRRRVRRLPAARRCTTAKDGRSPGHPPAREPAARRPRPGQDPGVQAGLPDQGRDRADHLLDRHLQRPPGPPALHRHRQEQRLAAQPVRRDQPADPGQCRPDPPRRSLGLA